MFDQTNAEMTNTEEEEQQEALKLIKKKEKASFELQKILGRFESKFHSSVLFNVDGTEYACDKRTRPGWKTLLWIHV